MVRFVFIVEMLRTLLKILTITNLLTMSGSVHGDSPTVFPSNDDCWFWCQNCWSYCPSPPDQCKFEGCAECDQCEEYKSLSPLCDMEKLYEDASREPSCASAVSNLFEHQDENCRCWRAMNATYRQENYDCRPDANMHISLNEQYELDHCEAFTELDCGEGYLSLWNGADFNRKCSPEFLVARVCEHDNPCGYEECAFRCSNTNHCNYFIISTNHVCRLYSACDIMTIGLTTSRICGRDIYTFSLKGRIGIEVIVISDGQVITSLMLTTEFTELCAANPTIYIDFVNDGQHQGISKDVTFRSDFETEISHSVKWADWNCNERPSRAGCRRVRNGEFNWGGIYHIEFIHNVISICDMDPLFAHAETVPRCARALAESFQSEVENCICWSQMAAEYRQENFDCTPDEDSITTLLQQYSSSHCDRWINMTCGIGYTQISAGRFRCANGFDAGRPCIRDSLCGSADCHAHCSNSTDCHSYFTGVEGNCFLFSGCVEPFQAINNEGLICVKNTPIPSKSPIMAVPTLSPTLTPSVSPTPTLSPASELLQEEEEWTSNYVLIGGMIGMAVIFCCVALAFCCVAQRIHNSNMTLVREKKHSGVELIPVQAGDTDGSSTTSYLPSSKSSTTSFFVSPEASAECLRKRKSELLKGLHELDEVLSNFEKTQRLAMHANPAESNISKDTLSVAVRIPFADTTSPISAPALHNPLGFGLDPNYSPPIPFVDHPGGHFTDAMIDDLSEMYIPPDHVDKIVTFDAASNSTRNTLESIAFESAIESTPSFDDSSLLETGHSSSPTGNGDVASNTSPMTTSKKNSLKPSTASSSGTLSTIPPPRSIAPSESSHNTLCSSALGSAYQLHKTSLAHIPSQRVVTVEPDEQCDICFGAMQVGERKRILVCGHEFHANCVQIWLKEHSTCPKCRCEQPTHRNGKENLDLSE